jgi:hypothetical protein
VFQFLKKLFTRGSAKTNPSPLLHWPPTGLFQLKTVGAYYYHDALAVIARNSFGENALVFCTATLIPEDTNPYDRNAIKIQIEGLHVGYLSHEDAIQFRQHFNKFSLDIQTTTCDAVISAGITVPDKTYNYVIELDIPPYPTCPTALTPTYSTPYRRDNTVVLQPQSNRSYLVEVWLDHCTLEDMHEKKRIHMWTGEEWGVINYYMMNRKGIGLGHKLFTVPKAEHIHIFGDIVPDGQSIIANANLISLNGRKAVIELIP